MAQNKPKKNSKTNSSNVAPHEIYNNGTLSNISTSDLLNNEVAIRQLLNDHIVKVAEVEKLNDTVGELKSDLEYQKTSPAYAIFSTFFNILGSILIGIGSSQLADEKNDTDYALLVIGGLLILLGNLMNILHRWIRQWCNKPKNQND